MWYIRMFEEPFYLLKTNMYLFIIVMANKYVISEQFSQQNVEMRNEYCC